MKLDLKQLKNLNVLYVEDDANVSHPTITLLENFFAEVFYSEKAEDALKIIADEDIHLLITDIELPEMSGMQLCEKIRETDHKLPIFITTAYDDSDTLKKAIKLNLVDFLIKPIGVKSIIDALTATLKKIENNESVIIKINENAIFHPLSGNLLLSGSKTNLTENELLLLTFLTEHKNQLITKDKVEELLYHDELMTDAAYKNLIYRLRKKIGKESLQTVVGVGIKLNV